MSRIRKAGVLMIGVVVLAGAALTADLSENQQRLRSMPLARRQELLRRLDAFERLEPRERAALRDLDEKILETEPAVRARYLNVLHQYHRWLQTLSERQRQQIAQAPPDQRIDVVRPLLDAAPMPADTSALDVLSAQSPALNPLSLLDQAHYINVWLKLDAANKKEIERSPPAERTSRIDQLGRELKIVDDRQERIRRFEEDVRPRLLARLPAAKKIESKNGKAKADMVRRMFDTWYLTRTKAIPVEPNEINRFAAALPDWLRSTLDDLPPAAAQLRLTVLYRLLFADGTMPRVEPAAAEAKPAPRPSKPPTSPNAGASPF